MKVQADTTVFLETLHVRNGWTIVRRYGSAVRVEHLPRSILSTPEGRHLEEFRRLAPAQQWCDRNDDYAKKAQKEMPPWIGKGAVDGSARGMRE